MLRFNRVAKSQCTVARMYQACAVASNAWGRAARVRPAGQRAVMDSRDASTGYLTEGAWPHPLVHTSQRTLPAQSPEPQRVHTTLRASFCRLGPRLTIPQSPLEEPPLPAQCAPGCVTYDEQLVNSGFRSCRNIAQTVTPLRPKLLVTSPCQPYFHKCGYWFRELKLRQTILLA